MNGLADFEKGASAMAMNDGLVHVVDEELSVRETLRRMLEADGFAVRCHASAGEFLAAWPSAPGCVLLDVRMPGPAAFDLQLALAYRNDALPVVFMGAYGDLPMSVLALKRGTVHFVAEPIQREALLAAVGKAVERSHAQRELDTRRRAMRERFTTLTARERAVFEQVTAGRLNKQIAATLCTCERTVKAHRANMMQKLQAHSVAELVRIAIHIEADADVAA
ncbi:response regulator transcription factor [Noviluteimonas gilva]|nr:LuxR C-terminal-related transcriptional regulator [Lysobacter gilvus]